MILQIGNKLGKKGKSESFMESLDARLKEQGFNCIMASDKKNYFLRMLEMIFVVLRNKSKTELIIIHAYSTLAFWYAYIITVLSVVFKIPFVILLHGGAFPNRIKQNPGACKYIFSKTKLII